MIAMAKIPVVTFALLILYLIFDLL